MNTIILAVPVRDDTANKFYESFGDDGHDEATIRLGELVQDVMVQEVARKEVKEHEHKTVQDHRKKDE